MKQTFLLAMAAVMFVCLSAVCQEEEVHVTEDRVDLMVDKAVAFLVGQQQENGRIGVQGNETTSTALAIMAMCSVGHMPTDDTKEGAILKKALDFVLQDDRQEENGYFGKKDGSRMYGHGVITLMLAEVLGMGVDDDQDRRVRQKLEKAIEVILWSQKQKHPDSPHFGGWRYEPPSGDSDLSATVWQLLALRASKEAGIEVPKEAIDNAVRYVKRCYHSPKRDKDGNPLDLKSACGYQVGGGPTYTSGAYGLLSLQVCGEYESPEVKGSADWLMETDAKYTENFFFYGTYYYMQGMYQYGGEHAEHAKKKVEEILFKNQKPDGSWKGHSYEESAGIVYSTSMALLSLSVNYNFLPIYQR